MIYVIDTVIRLTVQIEFYFSSFLRKNNETDELLYYRTLF